MLKYYITFSFQQFTKTLNQFFYLSSAIENFGTGIQVWFEQLKELKQFWGTFTRKYCHLQWNSYSKSLILNFRTLSIFPAPEIKKVVIVGKILWSFETILHIWLIYLFFSLDIPVIINILQGTIKILHEKMLNAIYLYWFHNDTLAENNSLNGHSNKPWING